MPAVEVTIARPSTAKFVEGPPGFFTIVQSMVENPVGSGLYDIPDYFVPDPDVLGLFTIPVGYLGSATVPLRNIKNFSVQEDATPIDPSSTFGGVGRIAFDINEAQDTILMIGQVTLVDGTRGKTSGSIRALSGTNGDVSVSADSALGLFNTDRVASPYIGTLGNAIQYYCDLVGIENDVVVDASITDRSVTYPGFKGNVWNYLKQLLVKEQIEIALVFNRVYVRPLRLLEANLTRSTTTTWNLESTTASKAIEIYYYNHVYGSQREIYPLANSEASILFSSLSAGETRTETIRLDASLVSVNQPVYTTNVTNKSYAGTNGVYSAFGNDNLPLTAAQWSAQGGALTVAIGEDPSTLDVTVTAPNYEALAPYTIGVSAGGSSTFNSLHITGTGVVWDKRLLTLSTGATNTTTSDEVGITIDNPFISTIGDAYSLGLKAAGSYAGVAYTISGTALDINRSGDGNDLIQATIADFNSQVASGTMIAMFNSEWLGQPIENFNDYWQSQVDTRFQNQLFGNAIGSRIRAREAYFRLTSATTTQDNIQFSAELDTLISDFNPLWTSETIETFNEALVGYTCKDFSIVPLRRT